MMTGNLFQRIAVPGVQGLEPYQPGKPMSELERELGIRDIVKLASNENPLGPSPRVLEAIRNSLADISRYPDGNGYALKNSLAKKYTVEIDQITLGNGSNDVLELIARTFLNAEKKAIYSQHAFAIYSLVVQVVGAKSIVVGAFDGSAEGQPFGHDLETMAQQITEECAVVFIANPNNPTGTYCGYSELKHFIESAPERLVIVVDEAYFEYVEKEDYPNTVELLDSHPGLVVTRTFSKAYGLAGLRVGYAISSSEIAQLLNRVRQPFNVNSLALISAEAALSDQDYIDLAKKTNSKGLNQLIRGFEKIGIDYIPSVGNFICFNCMQDAIPIYQGLLRQGIIVRPIANYGLPRHLRVSVGIERENNQFLTALESILK